MQASPSSASVLPIPRLRDAFDGRVLTPDDPGYDQARTVFYGGFLGEEGEARVRQAYPGSTWERLAAVKARYDPTNLLRLNENVLPAVDGPGR